MSDSSAKKTYFAAMLQFTGAIFFTTEAYTAYLKAETFEITTQTYRLESKNPTTPQHTDAFYAHLTSETKHTYENKTNTLSLASMLFYIAGYRTLRNGRTRNHIEYANP